MKKNSLIIISLLSLLTVIGLYRWGHRHPETPAGKSKPKLYWFIPDGFRADPKSFPVFQWANEGKMPNLKKLMSEGCYGYSWPVFPGHTPTNFATLMTGMLPEDHGISDGTMRLLGYPLSMVVKGGFSSFAKKVPPIWTQMEQSGYVVSLQSIPGSTPPEIFRGHVIKGRWGAWGVDFPAVVFQDKKHADVFKDMGNNRRLFQMGSDLTRFIDSRTNVKWGPLVGSELNLKNWGQALYGLVVDGQKLYLSFDRKEIVAIVNRGEWTDWIPVQLNYQLKDDYQKDTPKKFALERELSTIQVQTSMKVSLIRASENKEFRVRIIYDNLNEWLTSPTELAAEMRSKVGKMVDFVDNFPPQLVYFQEDKNTFLQEAKMSWDWHQKVVPYLMKDLQSDVVVHSIYTPNQMLTSRWWMPFVDPQSYRYQEVDDKKRATLKEEVLQMYQEADRLLGEILNHRQDNQYVVLSSDHGILPLTKEVRLNHLFEKKGWLKTKVNAQTQDIEIDWKNTKVVYLQMNNVYVHSKNLAGVYQRDSGENYEKLRDEVLYELQNLKDPETGRPALDRIWKYEQASQAGLPQDRVGDLILANQAQFHWTEDLVQSGEIFAGSIKGGYKQGIWPESAEGMLTPFVIAGPGIRKNCELSQNIHHMDQFATIAKILNLPISEKVKGQVLREIFE